MEHKLQCQCGQVKGTLTNLQPSRVNRAVCYCRFCQAYQGYLSQEATPSEHYDGAELFQMSPKDIHFSQGFDQIHAVKLTDKGPLRYYAKCCNTPLVNGLANMNIPFVGVAIECVPELTSEQHRQDSLGPILARVNTHGPAQKALPKANKAAVYRMLVHLVRLMVGWWLRGDAKYSPFIDANGQPVLVGERIRLDP